MAQGQVSKIFNDPIHGHIELHPLCVKIIDTPQFQRLRFIKQLGACYFVFPGASHNRFEHSLGVCHLAGQFAKVLQRRQFEELEISDEDVLCVEIAGLCHDLGHGPFSHVFDGQIFPRIGKGKQWKHEEGSIKMFDHLVKENKLGKAFEEANLNDKDQVFIKELINPPKEDTDRKGRDKKKWFLYEIVANKTNGIDVDKWDYFARDCHMLGIRNNFDHDRLMKFSRVIEVDDVRHICFRYKEAFNLYEMFHTRSALHRRAYQHKVNKIIEAMITDAIVKANDHIKIQGEKGVMCKMSECVDDMVAYTNLTDEILQQILQTQSEDEEMKQAKATINSVLSRKLYKFIGQTRPKSVILDKTEIGDTKRKLVVYLSSLKGLNEDDIHVHVVLLDYGKGKDNPMKDVRFYEKNALKKAIKVPESQVSYMLPEKFPEQIIRVFCKTDFDLEELRKRFTAWCKENDMDDPELS